MKIANIVSTQKVDSLTDFNIVKSIDEIIDGLPTLIVGYDYVDKNYPNFDIGNICLGENLYWTFKRTEKRDKYEEDLNWFISKVYTDLTKQIYYIFVDPIQQSSKTLIKIIKKLYSFSNIICYNHNEMLYLYCDNFLFGIDLCLLKYIGFDINKIKNKIKLISNVFLDKNEILIEYKRNVEALGNQVRYIPYLFSIRNEQNDNTSLIHIPRKS